MAPRYAIYFVPPAASELYRFGSNVLGYDCYVGKRLEDWAFDGIGKTRREMLTREPRRYGFHATLKAPFRLAPGLNEQALVREFEAFAAKHRPLLPTRLQLHSIGDFVALVPRERSEAIHLLATDCVKHFDRFRAPMSQKERKQRANGLNRRQATYLDRFGYPYVLDEFRFHMTLTGRLSDADRNDVFQALRKKIMHNFPEPTLSVGAITILRQRSEASRFRVVHQCVLGDVLGDQRQSPAIHELQRRISHEWP